jgi:thioredoxin 1
MTKLSVALIALLIGIIGCGSTPEAPPAEPAGGTPAPAEHVSVEPGSTDLPKLWDFSATWCPPCQQQKPIVHELQEEYDGKIEIVIIDVDENGEMSKKFNVQAIPTQVFLDAEGNELSRNTGLMSKEDILARFRTHGFID